MAHILVIEDDVQFRQMLAQMLTQDGHKIETVGDGIEALALLQSVRPQLIITDILMPNMDGVDAILEISRLVPGMSIIAMSGGRRTISAAFNLESAMMVGVKATLAKPFSRADLRRVIAQALA